MKNRQWSVFAKYTDEPQVTVDWVDAPTAKAARDRVAQERDSAEVLAVCEGHVTAVWALGDCK